MDGLDSHNLLLHSQKFLPLQTASHECLLLTNGREALQVRNARTVAQEYSTSDKNWVSDKTCTKRVVGILKQLNNSKSTVKNRPLEIVRDGIHKGHPHPLQMFMDFARKVYFCLSDLERNRLIACTDG
jgi:hypothetical protein